MTNFLKLNLGCGHHFLLGYLNVDKVGNPEVRWDLEIFPWPWENDSVEEIVMTHVLEYLGETKDLYLRIWQELYRICKPNAVIYLLVSHPRHDDFINDPTQVRAVTPASLELFSKRKNLAWAEMQVANSPLALYLDVDFEISQTNYILDEPWFSQYHQGMLNDEALWQLVQQFNNVVQAIEIELQVVKPTG